MLVRTLCSLLVLLLGPAATAQVVTCPPQTVGGVICIQGSIDDTSGGPLLAGQVYHAIGSLTVPAGKTLTVQQGAIVKFFAGKLTVDGTLDDGGGTYSSLLDDLAGGDTNADGAASTPSPGDWGGIHFRSGADASNLITAEIRFAGTGILLTQADVLLTAVVVENCSGSALDCGNDSHPDVGQCEFNTSQLAVDHVPLAGVPGFTGNTAFNNVRGDFMRIGEGTIQSGTIVIDPTHSINDTGIFVLCSVNGVTVNTGATLQFDPGCIVKFDTAGQPTFCNAVQTVEVNGTMHVSTCVFTSLADDTVGGDTNVDGSTTAPSRGDWLRIWFRPGSDASTMDVVVVRYAGNNANGAAVLVDGADVSLTTVLIEESGATPLRILQGAEPSVIGCNLRNNDGVAVDGLTLAAVAGFDDNVASGNGGGDHMVVERNTDVTGSVTITAENALDDTGLLVIAASPGVAPGADLRLEEGVVFKYAAGESLDVAGTLTVAGSASAGVVLTSIRDDSILGDTNADGAATTPAPGDWGGVQFGLFSDASVLDFTRIRFAGSLGNEGIGLNDADVTIRDSVIELCQGDAVDLKGGALPTIQNTDLSDNTGLPLGGVPMEAVPGFSGLTGSGNGGGDFVRIDSGPAVAALTAPTSMGPGNSLDATGVFVLGQSVIVQTTLDLAAGTVFKFELPTQRLEIQQTLTTAGSVVFTSFADDAFGGDTNGDGGATTAAPGQWTGLRFTGGSDASVVQNATVRFAGSPGIRLSFGADVTLDQVTVSSCSGDALDLTSTSHPSVTGCHFESSAIAVDGVPITALPGFSANTAALNAGDYQRVTDGTVSSGTVLTPSNGLNGGPVVVDDRISVPAGNALTVSGGVVLKFESGRDVDVDGELFVTGSAQSPAVFTSLLDDTSGDTNKDGAATVPGPGDWDGVLLDATSDASAIVGLLVRYAGAPGVSLFHSDAIIEALTVEHSSGAALRLGGSRPQVRRSSFTNNSGAAVVGVSVEAIPGLLNDTASGNAGGDHVVVSDGAVDDAQPVVISRFNTLDSNGVVVIGDDVSVSPGAALELRQGLVLKTIAGTSFTVSGVLTVEGTGLEPVVVTTTTDDAFGGDSNSDGNATAPAAGDWQGIRINTGAPAGRVEGLRLRYGGSGAFGALDVFSPNVEVLGSRVDHSAGRGFGLFRLAADARNLVAFGCGVGIVLGSSVGVDLVHATAAGNSSLGILKQGGAALAANCNSSGNTTADYSGFAAGEIVSSNGDAAAAGSLGNLDVDPQFVDLAGGDLTLAPTSPVIDMADRAIALAVKRDHLFTSRILDHDLDGVAEADMGAFEAAAWETTVSGEPRIGFSQSFTTNTGPAGVSIYVLGILDGDELFDPFGISLAGATPNLALLTPSPVPTGQPFVLNYPALGVLVGFRFGVQALTISLAAPLAGNFSNLHAARFAP